MVLARVLQSDEQDVSLRSCDSNKFHNSYFRYKAHEHKRVCLQFTDSDAGNSASVWLTQNSVESSLHRRNGSGSHSVYMGQYSV